MVIIDDFDHNGTGLAHYLKTWGDKWAFDAEIKGGRKQISPKLLIITSNYTIEELFREDKGGINLITAIRRRFKELPMVE